jgi:tRNA(Ile)-lysidine synthase
MQNKVSRFIQQHHLLSNNGKYLVALSGGADSVALLLMLRELHYRIEAVHCNFRLRGEESDRDEQFCQSLCQSLQIPLHRVHFDTRTFAELHQVSIEMAARELR